MALCAEHLEEACGQEVTVGVVYRHRDVDRSERVFDTNQRSDFVAQAILVQLEKDIELEQQTLDQQVNSVLSR